MRQSILTNMCFMPNQNNNHIMNPARMSCSSCGCTLYYKDAVGQWIKCPRCPAKYLIDVLDDNDGNEDSLIGHKRHEVFCFPGQCDYQTFRMKCFDMLMEMSPADIFSEMTIIEEAECFLPYVANIGGDNYDTYEAVYVGDEKKRIIMERFSTLKFKNNDSLFGTLSRRHCKNEGDSRMVQVDQDKMHRLQGWTAVADEIHYYPFYCMTARYKGTTFHLYSLGNASIQHQGLPVDGMLHKKPKLERMDSHSNTQAKRIAVVAMALMLAFLALAYWPEIHGIWDDTIARANQKWTVMLQRSSYFAYVLAFLAIGVALVAITAITILATTIAFKTLYGVTWLALALRLKIRNRRSIRQRLEEITQVQRRKQQDAYARFGISLDNLHDEITNLRP